MSRDPEMCAGASIGAALRPAKTHTENGTLDKGLDNDVSDDVAAARSDSPAGCGCACAGANSGATVVRFSKS